MSKKYLQELFICFEILDVEMNLKIPEPFSVLL